MLFHINSFFDLFFVVVSLLAGHRQIQILNLNYVYKVSFSRQFAITFPCFAASEFPSYVKSNVIVHMFEADYSIYEFSNLVKILLIFTSLFSACIGRKAVMSIVIIPLMRSQICHHLKQNPFSFLYYSNMGLIFNHFHPRLQLILQLRSLEQYFRIMDDLFI